MDCIVHGVTKSWIQVSTFHFHFGGGGQFIYLCYLQYFILTLLRSEIGDHIYIHIYMYISEETK